MSKHPRYEFAPTAYKRGSQYVAALMRLLKSYWWAQACVAVFICAASLAEGLSLSALFSFLVATVGGGPNATGGGATPNVFRWLMEKGAQWPLESLVIVIACLVIMRLGFTYGVQVLLNYIYCRANVRTRDAILRKLFEVPSGWLMKHGSGERLYLHNSRPSIAPGYIFRFGAELVAVVLTNAVYFALMLTISPPATAIFLGLALVIAFVAAMVNRRVRTVAARTNQALRDYSRGIFEILVHIPFVKIFNAQPRERKHADQMVERVERARFREALWVQVQPVLPELIIVTVLILFVSLFTGDLLSAVRENLSVILIFTLMVNRLQVAVTSGLNKLVVINSNFPALRELVDFLALKVPPRNAKGLAEAPSLERGIDIKGLSFSYPEHEAKVLNEVDLRIPAGFKVAVVGASGSGKSTILSLLTGQFDDYQGRIEIDGVELRELGLRAWLDKLAFVTQEPILFDRTVAENLVYGKPNASPAEIEEAVQAADAKGFIAESSEGYQTRLGEKGLRLSGGQKQRICIARAILKDPELYVFDEATSNLDNESQEAVLGAIEAIPGNKTVIVVAHRLSTVRSADLIYVMDRGKVVEHGTHQDLLAKQGAYRRLYNAETTGEAY